jgi:tetratricopeptide (TPR) repeat protein
VASYRAFLSYSHTDTSIATWLHHGLETYRVPSKLVGRTTRIGVVPRRLRPIFRDRDEFSASADLGAAAHAALDASDFLIVICSPAAAKSRWVNQEIISFKRLHGESRILAVIASGEPFASDQEALDEECFPVGLRFKLGEDGDVSSVPAEPIAADLRTGADGKRLAKLKLVAGLTGLGLDDLIQRETQRRLRRLTIVTASAMTGMIFAAGLAIYANARRIEANEQRQVAQQESATARAASDFLIGTFVLSDPATENPRTITAQTILDRSAQRALSDLSGQPVVQARLIGTLGQAYNNLGLFHEARTMIERSAPSFRKAGPEAANAELTLAMAYLQLGMLDAALATAKRAERSLGPDPGTYADVRARAAVTEGMVLRAMGEVRPGVAAFNRAIAIYQATGESAALKQSVALMALGNLLSDDGQFVEAEAALNQSLAINTRVLGPAHRSTGENWLVLAQNAFLSGDLPLAEKRIAAALAIERKMLDADNPIIADALSMQGQIFHGQGRLLEAERSLEEAIAIYEKAFGGPHYLIGIAQIYLALVESERGRTAKALAILDEAKRNYDASYGKLHANHGDLLVNRATILARAGRRKEAVADCAAGMKILDQTLGADAAFTKQLGEVCAKI